MQKQLKTASQIIKETLKWKQQTIALAVGQLYTLTSAPDIRQHLSEDTLTSINSLIPMLIKDSVKINA